MAQGVEVGLQVLVVDLDVKSLKNNTYLACQVVVVVQVQVVVVDLEPQPELIIKMNNKKHTTNSRSTCI